MRLLELQFTARVPLLLRVRFCWDSDIAEVSRDEAEYPFDHTGTQAPMDAPHLGAAVCGPRRGYFFSTGTPHTWNSRNTGQNHDLSRSRASVRVART